MQFVMKGFGTLIQVTSKCSGTFIHCVLRGLNDLSEYLFVHKDCCRDFTNPKHLKTSGTPSICKQGISPQNL